MAYDVDTVGEGYLKGALTWAQAEALCTASGKEFDGDACVAPGSPGTASEGKKLVAADTRATVILFGGAALVAWLLLR